MQYREGMCLCMYQSTHAIYNIVSGGYTLKANVCGNANTAGGYKAMHQNIDSGTNIAMAARPMQ